MDNNKFLQAIECCKTADCQNCPMNIKRTGSCLAIELFEFQALVGCKKEDKARYKLYYEMLKNNRARKNADIVEVVRCKDCQHYIKEYHRCSLHSEEPDQYSTGFIFEMQEDDFCSCGERKDG